MNKNKDVVRLINNNGDFVIIIGLDDAGIFEIVAPIDCVILKKFI